MTAVDNSRPDLFTDRRSQKKTPREGTKAHAQMLERQAKQAASAEEWQRGTEKAVQQRKDWEASPQGQERMKDVVDYATEQHNKLARQRPELGLKEQDRLKITPAQAYEHYGFGEHHGRGKSTMDQTQLPGMEDPQALPRPKQWEEYSPEEQQQTLEEVRHHAGVGIEEMQKSFGAQLDQGYLRARQAEGPEGMQRSEETKREPYAQDFYVHGEPAQKIHGTAERHGVSIGLAAAVNADTSPQMTFSHVPKTGPNKGIRSFPNAELADHIIKHIAGGGTPETYTKGEKGAPGSLEGKARSQTDINIAKGAQRAQQVIHEGKTVRETFAGTTGGTGFGPKTGAYHNAWLGGSPQFFVSDIHSGGGGMLPHQSTSKAGSDKSEREKTIEATSRVAKTIPRAGFHAMADYAARQAMKERGLTHIEQAQAVQWGEEQIQRGGEVGRGNFPSAAQAHPEREASNPRQFGFSTGPGTTAHEEAPKVKRKRGGQPKPKPPPEQGSLF